jgi:carbon storage regulator CsrA
MDIKTPRVGECIQVGSVTVTVLAVEGNKVRLMISAAQHDGTHREELGGEFAYTRRGSTGYEH